MRGQINGGWYCANTPAGQNVTLMPGQHLLLGTAVIPLPRGQNVLFVDLSPDGSRCAGIGHQDDHAWEWDGTQWHDRGPAFGPFGVLYDRAGTLHVVQPPVAHGYRYAAEDGRLVTAEETYADRARQVWAYTALTGVTIGQGGEGPHGDDPCIVLIDGTRRLLEPGRCRAIRVREEHGRFSIAMVREDADAAVHYWLTRAELAALSLVTAVTPDPKPDPTPDHKPDPEPEPKPMSTPNRFDVVNAEFARKRPEPDSTASCGQFTRRVAWALNPTGDRNGWGLLTKSLGEAQYDGYAVDALIYAPTQQVVDIIGGAEGPNPQPGWMEQPKRDTNNWAPPVPVGGGDQGDPGDENHGGQPGPVLPPPVVVTPPPAPVDLSPLVERLDALKAQAVVTNEHLSAIRGDLKNFTNEMKERLPAILAALSGGGAGGLLGGILGGGKK